jgi:polyhydroxyalkanoate synthase
MPESAWTHMLVSRWTLDETPLAQRLFTEIVDDLYRNDRFIRDKLIVGGHLASPARMIAPLLTVVDRRCRVAPPESILPFHDTVPSADRQLLWYKGDTGVHLQHVGMLVGTNAHHALWPRIVDWIRRRQRE